MARAWAFFILLITLSCTRLNQGMQLSKCGVTNMLMQYGFPMRDLADWACLIEHESSFRTNVVGPPNSDGSRDYGLFQINSRYWCQGDGPSYNMCRMPCRALLSNNMSNSIRCAIRVYKQQGLKAWYGWQGHCQGRAPSVNHCFNNYNRFYYKK